MKKDNVIEFAAGIGNDAVQSKTGKGWQQWFALLDKAGAQKMTHAEIAKHLYDKLGVPGWWNQMVAVAYEQQRGLREKHQKPGGYEASSSKTIHAPLSALYRAWNDPKTRSRWLGESGIVIRKATPEKSLRITWADGTTSVAVNFYPKADGKSQVTLQHGKLPDATEFKKKKAYWADKLNQLKELLEG